MTNLGSFQNSLQRFWVVALALLLGAANMSFASSPCSELLERPKTSELLKQKGLPVSNALFEIERMKALILSQPKLSGSILPLASRAYSDLEVKYKLNPSKKWVEVLVHKTFHSKAAAEFDGNWEAFQTLQRIKDQNLLGDFKLVAMNGRSIKKMIFFLDYVEGVEIYPLVMESNPRGAGYRAVQSFSLPVKDLLMRFNQSIRQVAQLWTQKNEISVEYEIEEYFDDIQGEEVMTYLLVNSSQTGERVFEISMFNTIYEPNLDAFVIFDPY